MSWQHRRVLRDQTRSSLLAQLRSVREEEARILQAAKQFLSVLARLPAVQKEDRNECNLLFADLLSQNPLYANIGLADAKGQVYASGMPIASPVDASQRAWYQRCMRDRTFVLGTYQVGTVTKQATENCALPVLDRFQRVQGILFAAISLDRHQQSISRILLPEEGVLTICDSDGKVLIRHPWVEGVVGSPCEEQVQSGQILSGAVEEVVERRGADGVDRLYAYARMQTGSGEALHFWITVPSERIFAAADRILRTNLVWMTVIGLVTLAAAWVGLRVSVLRPVQALGAATRRMREGDLSARSGDRPSGELGELGRAFDEMAQAVAQGQNSLRESEERIRLVVESALDAVVTIDESGIVTGWNTRAVAIFGWSVDEAFGRDLSELIIPERYRERHRQGLARFRETGQGMFLNRLIEIDALRKDGSVLPIELSISPVRLEGKLFFSAFMRDITRRKRDQEAMLHLAYHDTLTGFPNRALLRARLQEEIDGAKKAGRSLALLLLDLDRFKEINDTLGHRHGDELLRQIGARIPPQAGASAMVARLGGDEFAVLLGSAGCEEAVAAVRRILKAFEEPVVVAGISLEVRSSIGIAIFPDHAADADLLLQRADVAMYQAKGQTAGFAVYENRRDPYSHQRLQLLTQLRRAIETDQIFLAYQPKVEVSGGRLVGVEALVRWSHPEHGMMTPDQFIPVAERTGLIQYLTQRVLRLALSQCWDWKRKGLRIPVSVNLSVRDLEDPSFPDDVAALLRETGVPADLLEFEITESGIMADDNSEENLQRLNRMGIRISIDDFGTGYSSLVRLMRMPVEVIKIDKSFVLGIHKDPAAERIVRSIIELGHSLSMQVVAEGVESRAEFDVLRGLSCDVVQGYYMARPLMAEEFARWMEEERKRGDSERSVI